MSEFFTINYNGKDIKVTAIQTGQDLYYQVDLPDGAKVMDLQLEGETPVWAFMDEGITEESKNIGRLIELNEE